MKIFHLVESDLVPFETGHGTPRLAGYVETQTITAGFGRIGKGDAGVHNWPYWYEEVVYIIRGQGTVTSSVAPFTSSETHEVHGGDLFYIPRGSKISFEALNEEPFEILYVAHGADQPTG